MDATERDALECYDALSELVFDNAEVMAAVRARWPLFNAKPEVRGMWSWRGRAEYLHRRLVDLRSLAGQRKLVANDLSSILFGDQRSAYENLGRRAHAIFLPAESARKMITSQPVESPLWEAEEVMDSYDLASGALLAITITWGLGAVSRCINGFHYFPAAATVWHVHPPGAVVCDSCGKALQTPLRCSRCKRGSYCDAVCQRSVWGMHRRTCEPTIAKSAAWYAELQKAGRA